MMKTHLVYILLTMVGVSYSQTIIDINTVGTGSGSYDLTEFDNKLFFFANDGINGIGLYQIDNHNAPVRLGSFAFPYELTVLSNRLYFGDWDSTTGNGSLNFLETGSTAIQQVSGISMPPSDFIEYNGKVYCQASGIYELNSNGNSSIQISTFSGRSGEAQLSDGLQKNIFIVNDLLFFIAADGIYYIDTDNTASGPVLVPGSDDYAYSGCCGDYIAQSVDNYLLVAFQAPTAEDKELVQVDATGVPVLTLRDLSTLTSSLPQHFIEFDNKIFFLAYSDVLSGNVVHYFEPSSQVISSAISGNYIYNSWGFASDDPFSIIDGSLFYNNTEITFSGGVPSIEAASCFNYPYFIHKVIKKDGRFYFISFSSAFNLFSCSSDMDITAETCLENLDNSIEELVLYNDKFYFNSPTLPSYNVELLRWPQDPGNGFCDDCTATSDIEPPMFDCVNNQIEVVIDQGGMGSVDLTNYDLGITDNCGDFVITSPFVSAGCNSLNNGINPPIYTTVIATDNAGNATQCEILVNVTDPNGYCDQCSNKVLNFDGADDKIVVPTPLTGNTDYSISIDFNCGVQTNGPFNRLCGFSDFQTEIGVNETTLSYYNSSQWVDTGIAVADNLWHNATLVREGSMNHLYLDGNLVSSDSAPASVNFSGNMGIGHKHAGGGSNEYFNGSIDNVKVWNTALTEAEVCTNIQTGLTPNALHFDLEEGITEGDNTGIAGPSDLAGGDNNGEFRGFDLVGSTSNYTCQETTIVLNCMPSSVFENQNEFEIRLFPNPVKNSIILESENVRMESYRILSISGRLLDSGSIVAFEKNLDVSFLESGVYLIKVSDTNSISKTIRFTKI